MSIFTAKNPDGSSRLSIAKLSGIALAGIGLARALGVHLPDNLEQRVTDIMATLGGIGIWALRRANK